MYPGLLSICMLFLISAARTSRVDHFRAFQVDIKIGTVDYIVRRLPDQQETFPHCTAIGVESEFRPWHTQIVIYKT